MLSCRKGGPSLSVLRHWLKKRSLVAFQDNIRSVDLVLRDSILGQEDSDDDGLRHHWVGG